MLIPHYVLLIAIDPYTGNTVGLTKLRGPSAVLKKINFPGGKVEEGETVFEAASREMREETGLGIPAEEWRLLAESVQPDFCLTALFASTSQVLYARTQEEEPVWVLDISAHQRYAAAQPAQYAPGFLDLLQLAIVQVPSETGAY